MGKLLKDLKIYDSFYYVDNKTFGIIHYTYIHNYLDKITEEEFYIFKEVLNNNLHNFNYAKAVDILNISFDTYSGAMLHFKYFLESYLKQINSRIVQSV